MPPGHHALTDKEKQTLRLLLAGHDAKSLARHLGLSVHTINERLRDARRKLGASSSREAARLLSEAEAGTPDSMRDERFGGAGFSRPDHDPDSQTGAAATWRWPTWLIGGFVMLSFAVAFIALSASYSTVEAPPVASAPRAETDVTQSARRWLALVDAARWQDSWQATGATFRALNTVEVWTTASLTARVPLGAVVSRTLVSEELTPTPPAGNMVVKFRTRFANKPDAVETIGLVREDGRWKVVGYFID